MSSTSVQTDVAGRQITPPGSPTPFETPVITPIPVVWAQKDMVFKSHKRRTTELLELYEEEMFISDHSVVEEAVEALLLIAPWRTSQYFIEGPPVAVPTLVDVEQQVCSPQLAVSTTLLFDAAAPADNDDELALRNIICPEDLPAWVVHPVEEAPLPFSPTLDLFDADDLTVYPTLASGLLYDSLSQILDFDPHVGMEIEETVLEYAPIHLGRSLMRPPPVCSDAELDELHTNEIYKINKQGNVSNRNIIPVSTNGPCPWESEYDRLLRQITGQAFLPGIEHLITIEAHSAFITYDDDIQTLQQATAVFVDDRRDGKCLCVDNKVGSLALPGENFLLAENNTDVGLSMRHPTADSLLSLIDELVDSETLVEDFSGSTLCPSPGEYGLSHADDSMHVSPNWELPCDEDAPRPGAFFNTVSSQYTSYTALVQLFAPSDELSRAVGAQSDAADDVSDISDEEVDELFTFQVFVNSSDDTDKLSMSHPSELTHFDADSQQAVAYVAFNQLLLDLDDDETMTRIHRPSDEYDEDDLVFSDDFLEIGELPPHAALTTETSSPSSNDFAGFDFGFDFNAISYGPPDVEILNAVETEVLELIAYMFECMKGGQLCELQDLGSDLQWAVTAITDVYPCLGLMKHLATTVEILLERCVALGSK